MSLFLETPTQKGPAWWWGRESYPNHPELSSSSSKDELRGKKKLHWNREIKERNQRNCMENHEEMGSWHLSSLCVLWKWKVCSQGSQGTTGLDVAMGLRWLRMQPRFIVMFKELRLSKWRGDSETPMHNTKDRATLMGPGSVRMSKVLGVWDVCRWPKPWLHGMSVGLLPDPLTGNWRAKTQG